MDFTINLRAFADDTSFNYGFPGYVLRTDDITFGIDFPELLIQVKFRNDIDQFHVCFPIRSQCSYIFPVSVKFIGKQSLSVISAIRQDMFTEVTVWLILQCHQRLFECFPRENINSHRCQITSRVFRFFFKLGDPSCSVGDHNTETACLLDRHRHTGDSYICLICLMVIKHHFVIHLVDMVTGENQNVFRIVGLHVCHILKNCVCCSGIPVAVTIFFIGGKHGNTAHIPVQIPRNTDPDMGVQTQWLILGQYAHGINARVNTVAQRKIDNTIFSSKCYRRFGNLLGKYTQSASLTSGQQHCNHFFLNHAITSCHI